MSGYQEIDAAALHAMLSGTPQPLLVDVRTSAETAKGIIQGAILIPLPMLPSRIPDLDGEAPLVFYCHSGIRSAQAGSFLTSHGRENVFNLRGGTLAWGIAGYPLLSPPQE